MLTMSRKRGRRAALFQLLERTCPICGVKFMSPNNWKDRVNCSRKCAITKARKEMLKGLAERRVQYAALTHKHCSSCGVNKAVEEFRWLAKFGRRTAACIQCLNKQSLECRRR